MPVPQNKLQYILSSPSAGDREVFPLGEPSLKKKWVLTEDESGLYDYIMSFDGDLIFIGDDYHWIKAIEDSVDRGEDLLILLKDRATGTELLPGTTLKLNDGVFDRTNCKVTIKVTSPDKYEDFNQASGDTLNIFECTEPRQSITIADGTQTFEENTTHVNVDHMTLAVQAFAHYPNSRGQYPGFGCEGEIADAYWPESATKIFDTADLKVLTKEPSSTFEEYLTTGSIPSHSDYPAYEGAFTAVNEGWRLTYHKYIVNSIIGDDVLAFDAVWRWTREIKDVVIGTVMGPEWFFVGVIGGMDRYARPPIMMPRATIYKPSFIDPFDSSIQAIFIEKTNYVAGMTTAVVDPYDDSANKYGFQTVSNGYKFNDILEYAVGHCDPSLTVKSDFLQCNPFTVSGTNPVTGSPTFTDKLLIFQKSDVKRCWASGRATIGKFTPAEAIKWLVEMFKMRYRIDGTDFVIEWHDSEYFHHAAVIDLTGAPYITYTNNKLIYSYDKSIKLPAKETFKFMEARPQTSFLPSDDFAGSPILYDGSNVDRSKTGGVVDHSVDRVTTDIVYVLQHGGGLGEIIDSTTGNAYPVQVYAMDTQTGNLSNTDDAIADDGFCLIASQEIGGTRYGYIIERIIDDFDRFNNVLGWAKLHASFFLSSANAATGTMNGGPVTFDSTKFIKKSVELTFPYCDILDFDPFADVVTDLGTGIIKTAEYSIFDSKLTLEIGLR